MLVERPLGVAGLEDIMGDKGGKRDKAKNKQQLVKKHEQDAQRKQEKVKPRATT